MAHGRLDVRGLLEMGLGQLGIRQVRRVHDHARARLDSRLDLDLPLVGDRRRARRDRLEQGGRRCRSRQLLAVGPVRRKAVAALGRADDRAARAHDLRRGRHALDGLVEVLVEREARVGRQHDVERARHGAHRGRAHERRRRPRASRTARRRRPARCAALRRARRRARSRVPVAAAIARTSSCTGLPCVMPQRAAGWPMRAASCSVSVVSRPARPGATSFGPAREARRRSEARRSRS